MTLRLSQMIGVAALLATLLAAMPGSSSASTEIGNGCTATEAQANLTLTQMSTSAPGLPLTAPAPGVITQWKLNSGRSESFPQTFLILRPGPGPTEFTNVGETAATIAPGVNSVPARLPIAAGDHVGLKSPDLVLYCSAAEDSDELAYFEGSLPPNSPQPFGVDHPFVVPAVAVIEPDADHDGYGDETQDGCSQSASVQAPCPPIAVSVKLKRKGESVLALVTVDHPAPVTVRAKVRLGERLLKLKPVTSDAAPGRQARIRLKFPSRLEDALDDLPKRGSLKLKVTTSATSAIGAVARETSKIRLRG